MARKKTLLGDIVRNRMLYLLLLPTFAMLFVFCYFPALSALYHSLFSWDVGGKATFVGIGNFVSMVTDTALMTSALNMLKLVGFGLLLPLLIPLLTAALIHSLPGERASNAYRALFTVPMAIPSIVILLLWTFIYSPTGLLNALLNAFGAGGIMKGWMGDRTTALYTIMGIGFPWAGGFSMLVFYSGLSSVSVSLIDAAKIDGAGWWRRFWRIQVPLIAGQIRLLLILGVIIGVQGFENILILTNGGPGYATMVPGLRMYQSAFTFGKMGYACAIGTALFLIILLLTIFIMRNRSEEAAAQGASA